MHFLSHLILWCVNADFPKVTDKKCIQLTLRFMLTSCGAILSVCLSVCLCSVSLSLSLSLCFSLSLLRPRERLMYQNGQKIKIRLISPWVILDKLSSFFIKKKTNGMLNINQETVRDIPTVKLYLPPLMGGRFQISQNHISSTKQWKIIWLVGGAFK